VILESNGMDREGIMAGVSERERKRECPMDRHTQRREEQGRQESQ